MKPHADKAHDHKSHSAANEASQTLSGGESAVRFVDNRPEAVAQQKLQETVNRSPRAFQLSAQLKAMELARPSGAAATVQKIAVTTPAGDLGESADVPALPTALVTQINNADTPDLRQAALDALYAHVQTEGLLDETDNVTGLAYTEATYFGIAQPDPAAPDNVTIEITNLAFAAGAAVVYTSLRHELIHAEQYRQEPDDVADVGDTVSYMDTNELGGAIGRVQHAIQEVDTHVWELDNAANTGVDDAFRTQRAQALHGYYTTLARDVAGLGRLQIARWEPYINRAVTQAQRALDVEVAAGRFDAYDYLEIMETIAAIKNKKKREKPGPNASSSKKSKKGPDPDGGGGGAGPAPIAV